MPVYTFANHGPASYRVPHLQTNIKTVYTLLTMSVPRKNPRLTKVDALALSTEIGPGMDASETSSTEAIVAAIIRAIVEHKLQPGAKLVEQTIGDRFGVSRTIVRQALFRLSQLKLVRLEPARGAFVAEPSITEAREIFAVRRMVESQMLSQLVEKIKAPDIRRLKAHIKAERDAVKRNDVSSRTKLLFDFHVVMAQILGNRVLVELMQELVSRCSLITLMYQSADDAEASNAEHVDILHALEAKDLDRAIHLLHEHLATVEKQLTDRKTHELQRTTVPA